MQDDSDRIQARIAAPGQYTVQMLPIQIRSFGQFTDAALGFGHVTQGHQKHFLKIPRGKPHGILYRWSERLEDPPPLYMTELTFFDYRAVGQVSFLYDSFGGRLYHQQTGTVGQQAQVQHGRRFSGNQDRMIATAVSGVDIGGFVKARSDRPPRIGGDLLLFSAPVPTVGQGCFTAHQPV